MRENKPSGIAFWVALMTAIVIASIFSGCSDQYYLSFALLVAVRRTDLSGIRFTRWLVKHRAFYKHDEWYYVCECDCGITKNISSKSLKRGLSKSCGCLRADIRVETHGSHGEANKTDEYRAWSAIKYRCLVPTCVDYARYGGRGITICDRWRYSFENFLADMGRRPSALHSVERIKVELGYSPENCRWATRKEQANNTRSNVMITYASKTLTMAQWADELGVKYKLLWWYLKEKKVSLEDFVRIKNLNYETA